MNIPSATTNQHPKPRFDAILHYSNDIVRITSTKPQKADKADKSDETEKTDEVTVIIRTKLHDGGSRENIEGSDDEAFARYSDDNVRMMHLLGLDDEADDQDNVPESVEDRWRKRTVSRRKTRLSYEVHPDALFEDLVDDMPLDQDESLDIGADIDGRLRDADDVMQTGELSKVDLLRTLLEI